jgi:hypothetical protein
LDIDARRAVVRQRDSHSAVERPRRRGRDEGRDVMDELNALRWMLLGNAMISFATFLKVMFG